MKTKFILIAIGGSLLQAAPVLLAQNTNTRQYQMASGSEWSLSERLLLPPGLKEQLSLTEEQKTQLKPIEDDFAQTCREYQAANQPRIDAAEEADRQARVAKDTALIQAAHVQMQQVWAGLQRYRDSSLNQIKPLLTPDQVMVLEDPKNQWRENHADKPGDSSVD
jgi:Spy/CpxP family protein refolding chaperone